MRCDSVHQHLADYVDGRCGPITRTRIRRHVAGCGDCAEALREEGELDELLETWSDEQPSPAVWLRIREAIDMSPAYVPDDPPVPWTARLRIALVNSVLPYAIGVVTTVLVVMVGIDRTPPAPPTPIAGTPAAAPVADEADPFNGKLVHGGPDMEDWLQRGTLREGERSLRREDLDNLMLRLYPEADVRAAREAMRRNGAVPRPAETVKPKVQPASLRDDTH